MNRINIDISELRNGIYILQVKTKDGRSLIQKYISRIPHRTMYIMTILPLGCTAGLLTVITNQKHQNLSEKYKFYEENIQTFRGFIIIFVKDTECI